MKKSIILLTVIALAATGSYVAFAQRQMGGMQGQGMMGGGMQGRGMMMNPMGPMMGGSSTVAAQDGGVIVLMGNQLLKYDKNLNLAKKAEIDFDWEKWQTTMMKHRNMMMGGQSSSN